jgi:hypothetical protein
LHTHGKCHLSARLIDWFQLTLSIKKTFGKIEIVLSIDYFNGICCICAMLTRLEQLIVDQENRVFDSNCYCQRCRITVHVIERRQTTVSSSFLSSTMFDLTRNEDNDDDNTSRVPMKHTLVN